PFKRPTITDLENIISQWLRHVNEHYKINKDANEDLTQKQINISSIQFHPQACYTSRLLTEILDQNNSECLDCIIES
ncbi:hypothetical protein C1645_882592, partial [Glomus cerebriforme]